MMQDTQGRRRPIEIASRSRRTLKPSPLLNETDESAVATQ
jgi:hypothetical protein